MQKSSQLFSINTFCRSTKWHDFETVISVPFSLLLFKFCIGANTLFSLVIPIPIPIMLFRLDNQSFERA